MGRECNGSQQEQGLWKIWWRNVKTILQSGMLKKTWQLINFVVNTFTIFGRSGMYSEIFKEKGLKPRPQYLTKFAYPTTDQFILYSEYSEKIAQKWIATIPLQCRKTSRRLKTKRTMLRCKRKKTVFFLSFGFLFPHQWLNLENILL